MLEVKELTYAAIITVSLPDTAEKATVAVTLTPQDNIRTGSGETKALRDCTLRDLQEFADTLESEIWQQYQSLKLSELAEDNKAHVKITILNETGKPIAASADEWLSHVVILPDLDSRAGETTAQAQGGAVPPEIVPVADEAVPAESPEPEAISVSSAAVDSGQEEASAADEFPEEVGTAEPAKGLAEAEAPRVEVEEPASPAEPTAEIETEALALPSDEVELAETITVAPPKRKMRIAGLRRPLGHKTQAAVDILINEPPFRDAQAHSLTSLDREVAGVLVGPRPEKQPDGRYVVHITDVVIARHTRMHGASVTYTPESWRYIHDKLAERYPDEKAVIVGWYHTHPGFGIFLSGMDLFIHQNFFIQPWHVALVLDPLARRSGFFCWDRAKSAVKPYDFPWPDWAANSW